MLVPPSRTYQVNASWTDIWSANGLGWCFDNEILSFLGLKGYRRSLSPLHVGLYEILWAISCLIDKQISPIKFEIDYSDLVKMIESQVDWHYFQLESYNFSIRNNFISEFSIHYILRSLNVYADYLSKRA